MKYYIKAKTPEKWDEIEDILVSLGYKWGNNCTHIDAWIEYGKDSVIFADEDRLAMSYCNERFVLESYTPRLKRKNIKKVLNNDNN